MKKEENRKGILMNGKSNPERSGKVVLRRMKSK